MHLDKTVEIDYLFSSQGDQPEVTMVMYDISDVPQRQSFENHLTQALGLIMCMILCIAMVASRRRPAILW